MKRNNNNQNKTCPFLGGPCQKDGCQLYHSEFDRCGVELLTYNIYGLTAQLKKYNSPSDK